MSYYEGSSLEMESEGSAGKVGLSSRHLEKQGKTGNITVSRNSIVPACEEEDGSVFFASFQVSILHLRPKNWSRRRKLLNRRCYRVLHQDGARRRFSLYSTFVSPPWCPLALRRQRRRSTWHTGSSYLALIPLSICPHRQKRNVRSSSWFNLWSDP